MINVKDWGATGDGSTDDTAAINAAIDHAYFTGFIWAHGATIYFPPGVYWIGDPPLFLDRDPAHTRDHRGAALKYVGAGREASIIKGNFSTGEQTESPNNGFLVQCGWKGGGVLTIRDLSIFNESREPTSGALQVAASGGQLIANCHIKGFIGIVCSRYTFNDSIRDCVVECSVPISSANDATMSPKFTYDKFQDPVVALTPPSRHFGSQGMNIAQHFVSNCVVTGFDVGISLAQLGMNLVGNRISQCGVGVIVGLIEGGPAQGLDGLIVQATASWFFVNGGNLQGNRIDRCTWGLFIVNAGNMSFVANSITGHTGPTEPSAISGMSWNPGSHVVTVTSPGHNISTGDSPKLQIVPARWTTDPNGIVTVTGGDANTFTYLGPSSDPGAFDLASTWNYPLEYGITIRSAQSCFFAANVLDAVTSIASLDLQHAPWTPRDHTNKNTMWAMRAPYGWIPASPGSFRNQGWNYEQCWPMTNTVTFVELGNYTGLGDLYRPVEWMEYTVTDAATQPSFGGTVTSGGSNHYKVRYDGINWIRVG